MNSENLPNSNAKYIDTDSGLARVRGNKSLYQRMLNMFLASEEFAKFDSAIDSGDYAAAADIAHAIKGMTGNLSLDALFEKSTKLMTELRQGPPSSVSIEEYRDVLGNTLEAVRDKIDGMGV